MVGTKVSIVSDKPQTTRSQIRGIINRPDAQIVVVDTPGVHKPRSPLGKALNERAREAVEGVDLVLLVLDATAPVGRGDRFIGAGVPPEGIAVVNKIDAAVPNQVLERLAEAAEFGLSEYWPVSAATGEGIAELLAAIEARLPEGPRLYPVETVADMPEALWAAELVREQLLAVLREELPHSLATRVTEWEWPRIRCEILVERESQKGIVIGRGGSVLKQVGQAVRAQLPAGAYLELFVKVERDWQRRPDALERLGF
jgi:GTP-binding protein Era